MASPRFVDVPADRLQESLDVIGNLVEARGGSSRWTSSGRERVWELTLPPNGTARIIRVFTSMAIGATAVRDCGKDAVRVVVGFGDPDKGGDFRPLEKGQKILRTAPRDAEDRVGVFLERLRDQLRKAWVRANRIKACPDCGKPMAQRKGRNGPFLGCTGYPECRTTGPV